MTGSDPVAVSMGACALDESTTEPAHLYAAADAALYAEKRLRHARRAA